MKRTLFNIPVRFDEILGKGAQLHTAATYAAYAGTRHRLGE